MSPEDLKLIAESVGEIIQKEESSNGPVYVFLSLVVTISPFVFRYFKRAFVRSIEKVMQIHVSKMDDMFRIMEMHIDELAHVKSEVKETKEKTIEISEKVVENSAWIDSLREKC